VIKRVFAKTLGLVMVITQFRHRLLNEKIKEKIDENCKYTAIQHS
jgi:hypothetical protein